jgi:hypothetical protein
VEGATAALLTTFTGQPGLITFVEIDGLIYMGSPTWKGVYDINQGTVRSWGLPPGPMPQIELVAGDLAPGVYSLCYTNYDGDRLGGNGSFTRVRWETDTQGIRLVNKPADALCWMTHPNGDKLFLAQVSGGEIVGPTVNPLSTFGVVPPPGFSHFCHAFGRMWGACGKNVYYSDPFLYEWFRPGNFLPFPEEIVMVAPVNSGLFVNSRESTWFLDGSDPAKMVLKRIGDGAVPGTLTYALARGSHLETARTLFEIDSPSWMSKHGFIAGTNTGFLMFMTKQRLHITPRMQGAALYRFRDGVQQIITSLSGAPDGIMDEEVSSAFELGALV